MKIAFDLDSVVIDTYPILRNCIYKKYGYDIIHTMDKFKINVPNIEPYNMEYEINNIIANNPPAPIQSSVDFINYSDVCDGQNKIIFITARPKYIEKETIDWLDTYINRDYEVYFEPKKSKIIQKLNIDYFVDDRFKYIVDVSPHLRYGFLFNQPWNENKEILTTDNIIRIFDLKDLENFIKCGDLTSLAI